MSEINSLPGWARVMQRPVEMVAGHDLQPGDTVYFSARAYPRLLWKKTSDRSWSVMEDRGYQKPAHISIDPDAVYVAKRKTPAPPRPEPEVQDDVLLQHDLHLVDFFLNRPLTSIHVEGEHLAVGDVVYLNVNQKRAEILEIGVLRFNGRCNERAAKLHYLDLDKAEPYTFSGFRVVPPFMVVAGPKFAAARQDTSRIFWREGVRRWHWKG